MIALKKENEIPKISTPGAECFEDEDLAYFFFADEIKNSSNYYVYSCGPLKPTSTEREIRVEVGEQKKTFTHRVNISASNILSYDDEDYYLITSQVKLLENIKYIIEYLGYNGGDNVKYESDGICGMYSRYETLLFSKGYLNSSSLYINNVEKSLCCSSAYKS